MAPVSDRTRLRIFCRHGHPYQRVAHAWIARDGTLRVAHAAQVQNGDRPTQFERPSPELTTVNLWCPSCQLKADIRALNSRQVFAQLAAAGLSEVALSRLVGILSVSR